MSQILVGEIEQSSIQLIMEYAESKYKDVRLEPLTISGIRAKIKTRALRPETLLVILDESAYNICEGTEGMADVLKSPKIHKYTDKEHLRQFLISKFGRLDGSDSTPQEEEPQEPEVDISDMQVVPVAHDDGEIDKLKAIINTKDTIIENLNNQLKEIASGGITSDAEVTMLQNKITELETEVQNAEKRANEAESKSYADLGKVAKAEELINEVKDLHSQLNKAKEDLANAEYEKTGLTSQISELNSSISALELKTSELDAAKQSYDELQTKYKTAEDKLKDAETQVTELTSAKTNLTEKIGKLQDTITDLESKVSELDVVNQELTSLKQKHKEASDEISSLKERNGGIENLNLQITHLKLDLENAQAQREASDKSVETITSELNAKEDEYASLIEKYDALAKESDGKDAKIEELTNNITALNESVKAKSDEVESIKNEISDLNRAITEKENQLKNTEDVIEELKASATDTQQSSESLEKRNQELSIQLGDAKTKVGELESKLQGAMEDLENERKKREELSSQLDASKLDASSSVSELNGLREEIKERDAGIQALRGKLAELQDANTAQKNEISGKDAEILELNSNIKKYKEEIASLKTEAENKNLSADEIDKYVNQITDLEIEISNLKRTVARATAEKDTLTKRLEEASDTSETDKVIDDLKSKVKTLQTELDNKPAIDPNEIKVLNDKISNLELDLTVSRDRAATLELDVTDKDAELQELHDNIFLKLSDCSRPSHRLPLALPMPVSGVSNLRLFAAGTQESSAIAYETIRKIVSSHSDKRYLIIDLTTDSMIDSVFETKDTVSARSWLCNISEKDKVTKSFVTLGVRESLINTKYKNVKVLSVACKYFNSLAFFNVRWRDKLTELCKLADYVIVYVGNLDDVIHTVLYNSICGVAKGYIITKASPLNIRSTYFRLQSLQDTISNTVTYCAGMNEMSKPMYLRLAKDFKTEILDDSKISNLLESR